MNKSMLEVSENEIFGPGELSAFHRCIRCEARALVKAIKDDYELLFCGHHGREHLGKLQEEGWIIDDQFRLGFN